MDRKPDHPWYWAAQDVWVVQWHGKRVRLARGKKNKAQARAAFHAMMAEAGRPVAEAAAVPLVGELVVEYLRDLKRRRAADEVDRQTKADAERRIAGFAEMHGDLPADQVRPHHVDAWLDTKTAWGKTSRHDGVGAVKGVFSWAVAKGRIDANPILGMKKPERAGRRESVPDAATIARVFAAIMNPALADILTFIRDTGCRPKEARTLEARHLDLANGVAVFAAHKTARKTKKKRTLYLQGESRAVAARLAAQRPEGPIFLNSRGRPWTKDALVSAVDRVRTRAGVGPDVMAYALRHAFITAGAAKGVAGPLLAELAGHSNLAMLSTYAHLSGQHEALSEAAAKIAGPASED